MATSQHATELGQPTERLIHAPTSFRRYLPELSLPTLEDFPRVEALKSEIAERMVGPYESTVDWGSVVIEIVKESPGYTILGVAGIGGGIFLIAVASQSDSKVQPSLESPAAPTVTFGTVTPVGTGEVPSPTPVVVTTSLETTGPIQYYSVVAGDTLSSIAQRFGVTVAELVALNRITDPDVISIDQLLEIPAATTEVPVQTGTEAVGGPTVHQVQAGESLSVIASRYQVTVDALAQANNLTNVNFIRIGQELLIPGVTQSPTTAVVVNTEVIGSHQYRIQAGDTLFGLAQEWGTTVQAILLVNPQIVDPNELSIDQVVNIPR